MGTGECHIKDAYRRRIVETLKGLLNQTNKAMHYSNDLMSGNFATILFPLLGVNEADFILRVVSSEGHTQSMRSVSVFYPARAFPFYCARHDAEICTYSDSYCTKARKYNHALVLTLHELLIVVNPAGLSLSVEARDKDRTTGGGWCWPSCLKTLHFFFAKKTKKTFSFI